MRLFLDVGHYDRSAKPGARTASCLTVTADPATEAGHSLLLACAEGVAGRPEREEAARSATTALSDIYYSGGDSPQQALQDGLNAANQAVRATGERGRAAAIAALVLEGRRWFAGHAGDVRIWRYRDLHIKQLTRDHVVPLAPRRLEVTKACGYGDALEAEYSDGELKEGDIYLLTNPGLHDVLAGSDFMGVLQSDATAQQMAETLVQRALAQRAAGHAGICVVRVEKLPPPAAPPPGPLVARPDLPEPGMEVDGFEIEKVILKSRRYWLYKAHDREADKPVALRFPDPASSESAQAFLREESIGRRIDSPHLLKPVALKPGRRTVLYSAMEYRKTESLAKRIKRKQSLPLDEALQFGDQLLTVLDTLHRQGILHGDVRPHNVLYDKHKRQIYLLGFMAPEELQKDGRRLPSSMQSYRAPELSENPRSTVRSDIYATGVTIYRMLTGHYPYKQTDKEESAYTPLERHQPGLPAALDEVLARACAPDPADRFGSAAHFAAALHAVPLRASPPPETRPGPASPTSSALAHFAGHSKWAWGFLAVLLAGLLGYLYSVLR